jgi:selenocysteine lyase/cysteine desulfurase
VQELASIAYEHLSNIGGIRLYGPEPGLDHSGIISFNIDDIHPHDVGPPRGWATTGMGHHGDTHLQISQ